MSTILDRKRPSASKDVGWLAPYRDTFLTELGQLGYAAKTIGDYQRAIDGFCAQVEARGLAGGEIGSELPAGRERKGYIARFVEHLIDAGVIAPHSPAAPPAPGSLDELSLTYWEWLRRQRGLSVKTISTRRGVMKRFLTFRFGTAPGDLNTIARDDIVSFLDSPDTATGGVGLDYKATCLRSVFGLGRKSWLFCGSDRGGVRPAAMYTLIGTAKLNDVDPQAWLADVLDRIADTPQSRLHELLPWNWVPERKLDRAA